MYDWEREEADELDAQLTRDGNASARARAAIEKAAEMRCQVCDKLTSLQVVIGRGRYKICSVCEIVMREMASYGLPAHMTDLIEPKIREAHLTKRGREIVRMVAAGEMKVEEAIREA